MLNKELVNPLKTAKIRARQQFQKALGTFQSIWEGIFILLVLALIANMIN
jgi:hypothetical protein